MLESEIKELLLNSPPKIVLKGWKKYLPWERKKVKLMQEIINYYWKNGGAKKHKEKIKKIIDSIIKKTETF